MLHKVEDNNDWKSKYQDALRDIEAREQEWSEIETLLRKTIGDWLSETARAHPGAEAAIFVESGARLHFLDLDAQSDAVARGLMSLGVGLGEHVAIWGTNRPPWLVTQMAALPESEKRIAGNLSAQIERLQTQGEEIENEQGFRSWANAVFSK